MAAKVVEIMLDQGHGAGATHNRGFINGDHEGTVNFNYGTVLKKELEARGFKVRMTRQKVTDNPSLEERGQMAAGCDLLLSLPSNAMPAASAGSASGTEIWDSVQKPLKGLSDVLCKTISGTMGIQNRGTKYREGQPGWDWYGVLRASKAKHAMLIEHFFHDNASDVAAWWRTYKQVAKNSASTLAAYYGVNVEIPKPAEPAKSLTADQKIMGGSEIRLDAAIAWMKSKVANPKLTCSMEDLVHAFWHEGTIEGVRPELALCLSIHETGWYQYGGIVKPEQNNFAGLGALNGNAEGDAASFPDCQIGVRAVIQHLRGYATTAAPVQTNVDPRYQALFDKGYLGKTDSIHALAGKWAWPGYSTAKYKSLDMAYAAGETYGQSITRLYEMLLAFSKSYKPDIPVTKGLIGVFASSAPDMGAALRIVSLVPSTALIDAGKADYDAYDQILQIGGAKADGVDIHLGGKNRYETDELVSVWIKANR